MSDPRVFFAAERTLLAWVRTGLTIMGFGFVVARFGLFLGLLALQRAPSTAAIEPHASASNVIGIALVIAGASAMLFAAVQHRNFVRSLPVDDLPPSRNRAFLLVLALLLGSLGFALAVYLALG